MYKTTARKRAHRGDYDIYNDLENIRNAFTDAGLNAKGRAEKVIAGKFTDLKDKTTELHDNVVEYVTEKPFKTIGIALLTGAFISWWMRK